MQPAGWSQHPQAVHAACQPRPEGLAMSTECEAVRNVINGDSSCALSAHPDSEMQSEIQLYFRLCFASTQVVLPNLTVKRRQIGRACCYLVQLHM